MLWIRRNVVHGDPDWDSLAASNVLWSDFCCFLEDRGVPNPQRSVGLGLRRVCFVGRFLFNEKGEALAESASDSIDDCLEPSPDQRVFASERNPKLLHFGAENWKGIVSPRRKCPKP